jgi:hypothetical protein
MEDIEQTQDFDELKSYVLNQSDDASSWIDSDIAPQRAKATKYYQGSKFGNEEEGRSQVVLTEVRDTVGQILPDLMRVFFSGEKAVEFLPVGPEDIDVAEQATDYVNYIVQKDNPGFQICYGAFKDALVRKSGIIKYWWDELKTVTTHEFSGLTEQALAAIVNEPGVELVEFSQYPDPDSPPVLMDEAGNPVLDQMGQPVPIPPVMLADITARKTSKKNKVSLAALPPEEFLINRDARVEDRETWNYVEHRSEKSKGEIVALGYDPSVINWAAEKTLQFNQERIARNPSSQTIGDGKKKILYRECWVKYDLDGDGIDELLRVCMAGKELLHVEPTDDIPFAVFCPDPEPHTFFGLSEADKVMDLQEQKSFVLRNMFDSLAQSIHNRMVVVEGQVNMGDVLNNEVGGVIRSRAPGMVQPLDTVFVGQQAFPMLAYLDEVKENRTGLSKASMGLDADALQSTTRAAVQATVAGAQGRKELIARIFAETGMKQLFTGILKLVVSHQDKPRTIRLRNQWVEMDPRLWNALMDVSVNVAIGAGTAEDRIGFLNMIAQKQEAILQLAGMDNPLVSPINLYNTYGKMLELQGWKDPNQFFTDPQTWEPPPPQPDPAQELVKAQREQIMVDMATKSEELRLKREEMVLEQDFKRDQLDAEIILRTKEMEMQHKQAVDVAEIQKEIAKNRKVA